MSPAASRGIGSLPSNQESAARPGRRASPVRDGHGPGRGAWLSAALRRPAWLGRDADEILVAFPAGRPRCDIGGVRRRARGGRRLVTAGRAGWLDPRNAATRRATRVARNTWPASASMTATARAAIVERGEIPVTESGQRGEAEVLERLRGGGLPVGEERRHAQVPHRRVEGGEHQPDDQVGAQRAVDALHGDRRPGQDAAHDEDRAQPAGSGPSRARPRRNRLVRVSAAARAPADPISVAASASLS